MTPLSSLSWEVVQVVRVSCQNAAKLFDTVGASSDIARLVEIVSTPGAAGCLKTMLVAKPFSLTNTLR